MSSSQVNFPITYSGIMKNIKDKKLHRMQMVNYAKEHGFKPTTRVFQTTVKTVKKWCRRFELESYSGLEDQSHAPHDPKAYISDCKKAYLIEQKGFPKYQFTARDITSGLQFIAYANEKQSMPICLS